VPSERTIQDLVVFPHTTAWSTSAADHARKEHAYESRHEIARQVIECKKDLATLLSGQARDEAAVSQVTATLKALSQEEKLIICRVFLQDGRLERHDVDEPLCGQDFEAAACVLRRHGTAAGLGTRDILRHTKTDHAQVPGECEKRLHELEEALHHAILYPIQGQIYEPAAHNWHQ
jgi:hypothetical protein